MAIKPLGAAVVSATFVAAILSGCGGSASVTSTPAPQSPPTSLAIQGGPVIDGNTNLISAIVAIKGPILVVGTDPSGQNAIWSGSQKFFFYTDLAQATMSGANYDYGYGSYQNGSFLWAYRFNTPVINLPGDVVAVGAKNADVFLDLGVAADQITPTANKLTISGKKAVKTPYTIPDLDYTTYFLNGTAINSSGLALVNAYSFGGVGAISRPRTTLQRRALWNKLNPPLVGTATQVIANLKHRIRPTTTSTSPSGYYLLSTTQPPIPLGLPDGASGVSVFALNDQGISVGVAYTGDPNNPTVVPYYWDVQGDAFPMQLTSDLTFGYPLDINDFGTVVGQVGNGITTVGAMWNAVDAPPTNLNSLVPAGFPYNVQEAISIGNDFTVAAAGNSTTDTNSAFYFGLRPR